MPKDIKRRSLVKGAAWAAPLVAATATVPAYAASRCTYALESKVSVAAFANTEATGVWDYYVRFGDAYIHNADEGVTVVAAKITVDIEQKTNEQNTAADVGLPSPKESYVAYHSPATIKDQYGTFTKAEWGVNTSYTFFDYSNSSWTGNKVKFTANKKTNVTWIDNEDKQYYTHTVWSLENSWKTGTTGDPRQAYTGYDKENCYTIGIENMGWIRFQAPFALSSNAYGNTAFRFTHVLTLSNGKTVTWESRGRTKDSGTYIEKNPDA